MKYRKKPVIIEAIQFRGPQDFPRIKGFCNGQCDCLNNDAIPGSSAVGIQTLEGYHRADPGDWIIRGVKGELYPCKPDIFEMTYESAE